MSEEFDDIQRMEVQQNYKVEDSYAKTYLEDSYESEQYHQTRRISKKIHELFGNFLDDHKNLEFLRIIDILRIKPGDFVRKYTSPKSFVLCLVIERDGSEIKISYEGKEIITQISTLSPDESVIQSLTESDICTMYSYFRSNINESFYGEIEFFDSFSTYFNLETKLVYDSIPLNIQSAIMEELDQRTSILKKKNIVLARKLL